MLTQDDEGVSEVPRERGIANRLRGIFARSFGRVASDEDVWERERRHRTEQEQRSDGAAEERSNV